MINIVGLILIMMTAASVCAEDPIARENQLPDEGANTSDIGENEGDIEPTLIAPGENETIDNSDPANDQNFTDDMVISPGPKGSSKGTTPLDLPLLGIIGAVIVIALVIIGIAIRRK